MKSQENEVAITEDFEFAALAEARNYRKALVQEFAGFLKGDVIEIGAGIGQMTAEFTRIGGIQRLLPVEPNSVFCRQHRGSCRESPVLEGTIDDVDHNSDWDAIVSINVLEHIEEDEQELRKYAALLKRKGGALCLFVPARPEIYAPIDKNFGHFRRYTKKTLEKRLTASGFSIRRINYFNFTGYFAWWLNFCVLKKLTFEIKKVRFYDQIVFPSVHFLESRVLRPPLGQSLVVVATAK